MSNLTQTLRNNTTDEYSLESLFSNLLDESKRQETKDYNTPQVLYTNSFNTKYKGKKPWKVTKGKHCKLPSHNTKDCYFLFPEKSPKSWNKGNQNTSNITSNNPYKSQSPREKHPRDQLDENIDILYSKTPIL